MIEEACGAKCTCLGGHCTLRRMPVGLITKVPVRANENQNACEANDRRGLWGQMYMPVRPLYIIENACGANDRRGLWGPNVHACAANEKNKMPVKLMIEEACGAKCTCLCGLCTL